MHRPRRVAVYLFVGLLGCLLPLGRGASAQVQAPPPAAPAPAPAPPPGTPPCVPSAPDGYPGNACVVTIDRDNPASPAAMVVRGHTSVTIVVNKARWNETVTFTTSTSQVTTVDIAGTFFKNAISPLQQLVLTQEAHSKPFIEVANGDRIGGLQKGVRDQLNAVLAALSNATVALTCLETYKVLDEPQAKFSCKPNDNLTAAVFDAAKTHAIQLMTDAATMVLPVAQYKAVDAKVSADVNATLAMPEGTPAQVAARKAALAKDDKYLTNENLLNSVIGDAQTTQKTMMETAQQLTNMAGSGAQATYTVQQARNFNSTITVAAQEVISKTSTALGTVTISWQSNPWEISTGILFSTLVARSYTNAALIVNGQPVVDSNGKNLTVVTESDSRPVVVFPLVMANYRLRGLSHYPWENRCPNHCAFLVSGGVGLNLNAKTADFAVGPSFQIGEVLFTTAAHFGRESVLTNGVTVGEQLGSSPPSPLPTANRWRTGFGFAISYVLPFQ
jgi:hypothetical protein